MPCSTLLVNGARLISRAFFAIFQVLASVSTTIVETFNCQRFGDGVYYLNAQLSLPCDSSPQRVKWTWFAGFALAIYPFGVPLLLFCLIHTQRSEIKPILKQLRTMDSERLRRGSTGSAATMETMVLHLKAQKRRPSIVRRSEQQGWLMTKLDVYTDYAWWIHPVLLILRLGQSSLLALFRVQHMLIASSSCMAIVGFCVVREICPYRRSSE